MENISSEFERGYAEAFGVFQAATHPGYTKDREEAHRLALAMLKDGVSSKDTASRRGEFLKQIREKDRLIGAAQVKRRGGSTGSIVRPSQPAIWQEPAEDIWQRYEREMNQHSKQGGAAQ